MRTLLEDVHLRGHTRFAEREVVVDAVLRRHGLVGIRLEDKCWRRLFGDSLFTRKTFRKLRIWIISENFGMRL